MPRPGYRGGRRGGGSGGGPPRPRRGGAPGEEPRPFAELPLLLERLDGRSYGYYKDLGTAYRAADFELRIDHVQGDPFASPSRMRVLVPAEVAGLPAELLRGPARRTATEDFLLRAAVAEASGIARRRGSGKSGALVIEPPGQEVLERTALRLREGAVELRLAVGLPARGRRILGREASALLCDDLPRLVAGALRFGALDPEALRVQVEVVEDARALRAALEPAGLVAFVADGARLPRRSGVDPRPLGEGVVSCHAPAKLAVELERPNGPALRGLGIPRGVGLIVGGGYHGKSTLLRAIERGIYDHVPGDGREFVVAEPTATKVRAEDGRSVRGVDLSPFIGELPGGRGTLDFSSELASGSTSQAAGILEAVEAGARTLLIDEDTSATNFMVRDRRMQALVSREREPITPFVDRVRELHEAYGVSTLLVVGGSGDYLDVADHVVGMDAYRLEDLGERARQVAEELPTGRALETRQPWTPAAPRLIQAGSRPRASQAGRPLRLRVREPWEIELGTQQIDLAAVEQLAERGQLRAIGLALLWLFEGPVDGRAALPELLDLVDQRLAEGGLDALSHQPEGDLVTFRRIELASALNRLRSLRVEHPRAPR